MASSTLLYDLESGLHSKNKTVVEGVIWNKEEGHVLEYDLYF